MSILTRHRDGAATDEDLLVRIAAGDADAYRVLVERHAPIAYALAFRLCLDTAAAEATAQKCLVSVWQDSHNWVAENTPFAVRLHASVVGSSTCAEPKTSLGCSLEDAVAMLPPQQRVALTLLYVAQFKPADIALVLGITDDDVGILLQRVRRALRETGIAS